MSPKMGEILVFNVIERFQENTKDLFHDCRMKPIWRSLQENGEFRLSRYVLYEKLDDNYYLYNLKNCTLLKLNETTFEKVHRGDYSELNEEIVHFLKNKEILIPKNMNEGLEVLNQAMKEDKEELEMSLTIAPTFLCNMDCEYCFTQKDTAVITDEILNKIYKMIERHLSKRKAWVNIIWFGGEPLIGINLIEVFMKQLTEKFGKDRIHSMIVTNGYLLDEPMLKRLLEMNINTIQITFDGDQKRHDQFRKTKTGEPSYKTIFQNVINILKTDYNFLLNLRCNFFPDDVISAESFFSEIKDVLSGDSRVSIQLKPVLNFSSERSDKFFNDYFEIEPAKHRIAIALSKKDNEIRREMPQPRLRWCSSGEKNIYNIGPLGELYFCKSEFGRKDAVIGSLGDNGEIIWNEHFNNVHHLYNTSVSEQCMDCNRLPICMGGCKIFQMNKSDATCYWRDKDIRSTYKLWLEQKYLNKGGKIE